MYAFKWTVSLPSSGHVILKSSDKLVTSCESSRADGVYQYSNLDQWDSRTEQNCSKTGQQPFLCSVGLQTSTRWCNGNKQCMQPLKQLFINLALTYISLLANTVALVVCWLGILTEVAILKKHTFECVKPHLGFWITPLNCPHVCPGCFLPPV